MLLVSHLVMKTLLRSLAFIAFVSAEIFPLRATDQPALTAATGYVPCKISSKAHAAFPVRLMTNGVTHGEVQIILEVGIDGQLTDALLAAYTHRDFADEALRVLKASRFTPSSINGQPVISVVNLTFRFETSGVLAFQRIGLPAREIDSLGGEFEYRPHGPSTIDQPPSARQQPGPIYPKEWGDEGRIGSVTVDFYIDENGRTRMPVALDSPDEYLAAAAIDAVKEWRFETPRYRGKPALAHAQQLFVFKPEPKPAPKSGA